MNLSLFDAMAMDTFGDSKATIIPRMQLQAGMVVVTRLVVAAPASAGDASLRLRPETAAVLQGDLLRDVRMKRGEELALITKAGGGPEDDEWIARGDVLIDLAEGDVLDLTPPTVELICFERAFDADDKANARIDFRNLHLSRDEAKRQRIDLTAEVVRGDIRSIREGSVLRYEDDDFVFAGVVRSADRRGRRFIDLQVEVEEGES